jgi:hypothetical protein
VLSVELGSGQISINNVSVAQGPSPRDNAATFSLNGVHLYPGSKITAQRVDIDQSGTRTMRLAFESPADPIKVRDWFKPRLEKVGYALSIRGNGLSGKDNIGRPFDLALSNGPVGSQGVIVAPR